MSREFDKISKSLENMELPDIGGMDGGTIQIILLVIVGLWLFRKLKSLFFIFLMIVGVYYFLPYL